MTISRRLIGAVALLAALMLVPQVLTQAQEPTATPSPASTATVAATATVVPTTAAPTSTTAPTTAATVAATAAPATTAPTAAATAAATTAATTATTQTIGNISVDGSSILQPILKQNADAYTAKNAAVKVDIQVSGTDGGFDKFCAGATDINMATKGITDTQAGTCAGKSVSYVETLIGYDAAVLVVGKDSKATCLANDELTKLLGPGGVGFNNWQQVSATVGDAKLGKVYAGENARATNLFLPQIPGGTFRSDVQYVKDGAAAIDKVVFEPEAVALATYKEYQDASGQGKAVKILQLKSQNVCTDASQVNFELERYPVSQPLYLYVNVASLGKPQVSDFMTYIVSDGKSVVSDKGFIQANDTTYARDKNYIENKQAGRTFSRIQAVNVSLDTGGTIIIAGSPAIQPGMKAVSTAFQPRYSKITVTTSTLGDTAGYQKLCVNGADIVGVSRSLTDAEAAACKSANVNTLSLKLGSEAAVVLINAKNTFATCLTTDQLGKLFGADSDGKVKKWSDVDAKFPATDLLIVAPTAGTSAADLIALKSLKGIAPLLRRDMTESDDTGYRAAGIGNVEGGVTFMSYAEYKKLNAITTVKVAQIDAGKGCVSPDEKTIFDGSYPLSRTYTLLINQSTFSRPEVKAFVWYLMSEDGLTVLADQAGLVGVDKDAFVKARDTVLDLINKAPTPAPTGAAGTTAVPTVNLGLNPATNPTATPAS